MEFRLLRRRVENDNHFALKRMFDRKTQKKRTVTPEIQFGSAQKLVKELEARKIQTVSATMKGCIEIERKEDFSQLLVTVLNLSEKKNILFCCPISLEMYEILEEKEYINVVGHVEGSADFKALVKYIGEKGRVSYPRKMEEDAEDKEEQNEEVEVSKENTKSKKTKIQRDASSDILLIDVGSAENTREKRDKERSDKKSTTKRKRDAYDIGKSDNAVDKNSKRPRKK